MQLNTIANTLEKTKHNVLLPLTFFAFDVSCSLVYDPAEE